MTQEQFDAAIAITGHRTDYLSRMSLTGGMNGYPEPYEGEFVYGFETFLQAADFAEKFGGTVAGAQWRDGWSYAVHPSPAYAAMTISGEDYGDDYRIVYNQMTYEECLEACGLWSGMDDEEKRAVETEARNIMDDLSDVCWKKEVAVFFRGKFHETVDRECMCFSHDTHTYAVGVWLDPSDIEEEEDDR